MNKDVIGFICQFLYLLVIFNELIIPRFNHFQAQLSLLLLVKSTQKTYSHDQQILTVTFSAKYKVFSCYPPPIPVDKYRAISVKGWGGGGCECIKSYTVNMVQLQGVYKPFKRTPPKPDSC